MYNDQVERVNNVDVFLIFFFIRHGDEATGSNYTIYLEHLGGFLPILKGKKTSKLKPEFVIFDPLKGENVRSFAFDKTHKYVFLLNFYSFSVSKSLTGKLISTLILDIENTFQKSRLSGLRTESLGE